MLVKIEVRVSLPVLSIYEAYLTVENYCTVNYLEARNVRYLFFFFFCTIAKYTVKNKVTYYRPHTNLAD